ncbi:MAG: hypothetical protein JWQ76_3445 [Ramlibacter sp.]|nr:hypothetical protein [Ramlibacter sp.]
MNRDLLTRIVVLGLLLAGALWLATATEWVDVQVDKPPRGAAAHDGFFATEQVLRQLGARVERRQALAPLPPPDARLVLSSQHWQLFPDRALQLRRWVEAGGHLVLPATLVSQRDLATWLPLVLQDKEQREPGRQRRASGQDPERFCRQLTVPANLVATGSAGMRLCATPYWRALRPRAGAGDPLWLLEGAEGTEILRMPLGRGSVTAYAPWTMTQNKEVLRADHALALSAALQLEPGATVWLVTEEAREPLLAWIWNNGWVAVLLVLAAAAAWLWRAAVRFGPVGALPPPQRRSMKDQVAGTGAFLRQHGTAALHAAQLRALKETARVRLPGFASLDAAAANQAIAKATALDAAALAHACQPGRRTPDRLPADLELLEAARRRLDPPTQRQRLP